MRCECVATEHSNNSALIIAIPFFFCLFAAFFFFFWFFFVNIAITFKLCILRFERYGPVQSDSVGLWHYILSCSYILRQSNCHIYVATNPMLHKHTKHIKIYYHYKREKVTPGVVKLVQGSQLVDLLTKALNSSKFKHLMSNMGIVILITHIEGECKV